MLGERSQSEIATHCVSNYAGKHKTTKIVKISVVARHLGVEELNR